MKKGFTLVELLAVIVILAIILAIAVPTISSLIDNYQNNTSLINEKIMIKAAKNYMSTHSELFPESMGSTIEIKLEDLKSSSNLSDIKDPKNNTFSCDGYVLITKTGDNQFDYSPRLSCGEGVVANSAATDGLLAHYKLDNHFYDSSLYNINGTNNGSVTTQNRFLTNNSAMYFSGTSSINTNYDISWNNTNQITVMFWVKPDNVTEINKGIIGKKYSTYEWAFFQANKNLQLVYWDKTGNHGGGMELTATDALIQNKWVHVAYTWDGSIGKIYINGILSVSRTSINPTINMNNTASIMIGGNMYVWGDSYFKGCVDDIKFYGRSFSANEILQNYKLENIESL